MIAAAIFSGQPVNAAVLRVCADPDNLPVSSDSTPGFENRIAAVLAADLRARLDYSWAQQKRSFLRQTLFAGACDVVISLPVDVAGLAMTRPYFTASYVAVTAGHAFSGFDDPWLRQARIGLPLIGAEGANIPPASALARRGLTAHITGFPVWGGGAANPRAAMVDAVASGGIDVAFLWGPVAYYSARAHPGALRITPLQADPGLRFTYHMALAVRPADVALRDRLQIALDRHQAEVAEILRSYGLPAE